jgi:hypothetical protein
MEFAEYKSCVERLPFGKRLPVTVYVLRDEGVEFGEPLDSLLARLQGKYEISSDFKRGARQDGAQAKSALKPAWSK